MLSLLLSIFEMNKLQKKLINTRESNATEKAINTRLLKNNDLIY